jgi:large repetitive protein
MKTFKGLSAVIVAFILTTQSVAAQSVLDPNDPIVVYNPATPPVAPPSGQIGKWVKTNRLSWNTTSFKAYHYNGYSFRLKFPKTYNPTAVDGKKYPMLVFFHGRGEAGTIYDNEYSLLHGGQTFRDKVDNGSFDGYVLVMQTTNGFWGPNPYNAIRDIINYMVDNNKLDGFRVIANGLSSGGSGTWEMTINHPTFIAGCLPMSASSTLYNQSNIVQPLKFTPIWIFQGGLDPAPTPYTTEGVRDAFLAAGGTFKYTLYSNLAHGTWNTAWAEPDFFPFINRMHKANPWPLFGRSEFCPGDAINITLGLTAGFAEYEWRKDGVLIPGATTNTLVLNGLAVPGNPVVGVYSARVRRGSVWSDWSPIPVNVGVKPPTTPPTITISGLASKVIPSPDGKTSVTLSVPNTYQSYLWQKEGNSTTVSTANTLVASTPGDYKVRVTEQFGCSTEFSNLFTVIDANGPNKPDAAINLVVTPVSTSSLQLNWSDNPAPQYNETNFEVYRSNSPGGPYTLVHITSADVLTYTNTGLLPKTKYHYIVRAVNNTSAALPSSEANGTTMSDDIPPTAPANLVVAGTTRTSVSLRWNPSTDNTAISKYDVYVNGVKSYVTTATQFAVYNLQNGQTYNFTVRARDAANNVSPASNQVTAQPVLAGLPYKYYTFTDTWNSLQNFANLQPVTTGIMPNVALTPRTQNDNFAFLWEGQIIIPQTGTYYLRTNSDDGSRVWLGALNSSVSPYAFNAAPVVDNDGLHGAQNRTSVALNLTAGVYPIAIAFYEQGGGEGMTFSWRTPSTGTSYVTVPNSAFSDVVVPPGGTAPAAPDNLVATAVSFNRINLNWTDNSSNETAFEIWRSTNATTGFITIGTAPANTIMYADTTVAAATTYFYRIRAIGQFGESALIQNINTSEAIWNFNNNYSDASGNNRTLAQNNNPVFDAVDWKESTHAIRFNGTNQSATMPTTGSFLQTAYSEKTIAFWMKSNNNTGNRIVADIGGNDDGLAIRLDANTLHAGIASNNVRLSISTPYNLTGWSHIALVYKGNSIRLFLNGTEVASNNALPFTATTTTTGASRIGGNNGSNAFNTGTAFFNGWIDRFIIYTNALTASNVARLMNANTLEQSTATTASLPVLPGVPANLLATGVSTSKITVTWDDVANENSYEVYRSSNNNSNYVLFATVPANTTSLSDSGLFANFINYYKVRAVNNGGNTAFSNEDSAKTQNNIPVLSSISNQYMRFGTTLEVPVSGSDADPETLTVNVNNLPSFGSYVSTGNGTGKIVFDNPASTSVYSGIEVVLADQNGGTSTLIFNLVVNDNYLPEISAVGNVTMNEQQAQQVNISATDQNAADVLTWSFSGLPAFAVPAINAGNVVINLTPGLADHGVYNVTATVDDGNSGVANRSFVITVNNVNPNKKTYINFTDGSLQSPAPWNNTNKPTPSLNDNFINLLDETGSVSGIGLRITSPWQNIGNATNTLGVNTGNNSGLYPDNVIRSAYFTNAAVQTIQIHGLNPAYKYNFTFFGSRGAVSDDRTSIYTINGNSVTLNAANNSQNTASINSQQPAGDGTLVLTLAKGPASSFGYLNAMVIESLYDDGTAPAKPRNLTGTLLPNNNVRLNWIDASYNETSYQVYRSTTNQPGSFTLLNPGGNNANIETYTDATTTGNTTVYYYVKAVNSIGGSPESDTVAVTVPNVAPSIAAIANVAMKTQQVVNVNITATDAPGDVITLSATGLPPFATFTDNGNGTGVITITPGNTIASYSGVTITATDNFNASSSRQFNIAVSDKDISTYYVNFNQVLPVGSPWNSFNSAPVANAAVTNISDEAGVTSGISVTLVDAWDNANDVGATTGTNSGVFPDNVMRTAYFTAGTAARRIRISGLSTTPGVKFNLKFFASRGGAADVRNTVYTYNDESVILNASNNTSNIVQLQGVTPNASGIIEFTAQKEAASAFAYINALVIESYIDNGLPVAPAALKAVAKTNSSVELSWTDKSSNEEGFEVHRSTSANGTFTLIHTTGANVSTYVDGGLSANTIYFYKVRAKKLPDYSAFTNTAGASPLQYSVYVNFNQDNPAPAPWNNTNEGPIPDDVYFNLFNTTNNPSGMNMTVVGTAFNGVNPFGVNTGNNSGVYPDQVISTTWWLDANTTAMLRFDGLSIAATYNFTFFASRVCQGCDRTTIYTINGRSVSLNAANNSSTTVTLTDIAPDENGSVLIEIKAGGLSAFAYIGSVVIDSYTKGVVDENAQGGMIVAGGRPGSGQRTSQQLSVVERTTTPTLLQVHQNKVSLFPNPFAENIAVRFELTANAERLNVFVRDVAGRTVFTKELRNLPAGVVQQSLGLDGNKLKPGVYFATITGLPGNETQTIRIVKNK